MAPMREGQATDAIADILEQQPNAAQERIVKTLAERFAPDLIRAAARRRDEDDDDGEDADDGGSVAVGLAGCDASDGGRGRRGDEMIEYESSLGSTVRVNGSRFDRVSDRVLNADGGGASRRR